MFYNSDVMCCNIDVSNVVMIMSCDSDVSDVVMMKCAVI